MILRPVTGAETATRPLTYPDEDPQSVQDREISRSARLADAYSG